MLLSEQELQALDLDQQLLELEQDPRWQSFRKAKLEDAVSRIEHALATDKQQDWDSYLSLWHRREALLSVLGEFERMKSEVAALTKKAATEPDNGPATGELA